MIYMKIFKKIFSLMLVFLMMLSLTVSAAKEVPPNSEFRVFFDGQEITFPDQKPFASPLRYLYVPLRAVGEATGFEISWDEEARNAIVKKGDRTVVHPVDDFCFINEEKKSTMFRSEIVNDRIMVSQYGICHLLDCTMSWDDINRILYFYSNEKYENGFPYTQGTHLAANTKGEAYQEFYSMAEPAFIFPGLNEHLIPQGIAYRKDTNQFYLSGYLQGEIKNRNSSIIVVDAETGEIAAQYQLLQADGTPHHGHMGGIAVSDKDVYFENGKWIQRISLETIDNAPSGSFLKVEEKIMLTLGQPCANDWLEISDGYLWMGNYYESEVAKFSKLKITDEYPFLIRGYKLDSSQPNGFASEYKVEGNELYDYVPEILYTVDEDRIQGMTKIGSHIITATSLHQNDSELFIYDTSKAVDTGKVIELDNGAKIPLYKLTLEKSVTAMPYIEEIAATGGNLYAAFESAGMKFRKTSNKYTTDSVWKIDIEKLLAPVSE